jgi:hypothetical protein
MYLCTLLHLRPTPRCSCGISSTCMLRGVGWRLVTDVSGQPIDPIFKGQAVREAHSRKAKALCTLLVALFDKLEYVVKTF